MKYSTEFPQDFPIDAVHLGDCVELLRKLPDSCAQLVIADPPYNLGPRFGLEKEWVRDEKWLLSAVGTVGSNGLLSWLSDST